MHLFPAGIGLIVLSQCFSVLAAAAAAASTVPTGDDCIDNPNYQTKLGLTCAHHNAWNCEGFASAGFDEEEVDELLTNCPVSCGTCEGAAGQRQRQRRQQQQMTRRRELLRPRVMEELKGRADIVDVRRKNVQDEAPRDLQQQREECVPGWGPLCQDDPNYFSPQLELPCWSHSVVDCKALINVGLTELEVMDLVEHCPCSCNVECGTFTLSPTPTPTESPTVTVTERPTHRPTMLPTMAPTAGPTRSPTIPPTPAPTKTPTASPSARPSSAPSAAPTRTISSAPTSPIIAVPKADARIRLPPQTQQEGDESGEDGSVFSIYVIAGIASGGVAFIALAAILFAKAGRGSRPQTKDTVAGSLKAGQDGGEGRKFRQDLEWCKRYEGQGPNKGYRSKSSRPKQILRDDISMATKDIGNVEVELERAALETIQRARQGKNHKVRDVIGRTPSPRSAKRNFCWYDEERGQEHSGEGNRDGRSGFGCIGTSNWIPAMEAAESEVGRSSTNTYITESKTNTYLQITFDETPSLGSRLGPVLNVSHSGSNGSASRKGTVHSRNLDRKEELVYKGSNKAGVSPEVEAVRTISPEVEAATKNPAETGIFSLLFGTKKPKQQEVAASVQDIDLEDGTPAVPTVDTQLSGILRGQGPPSGASHVYFGPQTKGLASLAQASDLRGQASLISESTVESSRPSKDSKSTRSDNPDCFWNAVDAGSKCIEETATCDRSKLLAAPSRLSAIPSSDTTKDAVSVEAGVERQRQLSISTKSKSGSISRSESNTVTTKPSLTTKTSSCSRTAVSTGLKSKRKPKAVPAPAPAPAPVPASSTMKSKRKPKAPAPASSSQNKSASRRNSSTVGRGEGRVKSSLRKGTKPRAGRLIAHATPSDDKGIGTNAFGIATEQTPMRMQASIANTSEASVANNSGRDASTGSFQPSQRELTRSHTKASVREKIKAVRSTKTKTKTKVESEHTAHNPPVQDIGPHVLTSVESGITTPTTIQPDQSALMHLDNSPSYESTYGGKPRTSEKYTPKEREHRREDKARSSSRREDRPPRSSSRHRESSRDHHPADDRRRSRSRSRSGRQDEHPERRYRSRSRSHSRSQYHNDHDAEGRRQSRRRDDTRHRESSAKDQHREKSVGVALFQPRLPFLDDSTLE